MTSDGGTTPAPPRRMDIRPDLWGPIYWKFLHAMADGAPDEPTEDEQRAFMSVIDALPHILPCTKCRNHLRENYEKGSRPRYENRDQLRLDLHELHNLVNQQLGKKVVGFDCCSKSYLNNDRHKPAIIAIVVIIVIALFVVAYGCRTTGTCRA